MQDWIQFGLVASIPLLMTLAGLAMVAVVVGIYRVYLFLRAKRLQVLTSKIRKLSFSKKIETTKKARGLKKVRGSKKTTKC